MAAAALISALEMLEMVLDAASIVLPVSVQLWEMPHRLEEALAR